MNEKRGENFVLSTADSAVKVAVIPTNEELAIARQALARLLERAADPSQPSRTTWVEVTLIHRRTSPFVI